MIAIQSARHPCNDHPASLKSTQIPPCLKSRQCLRHWKLPRFCIKPSKSCQPQPHQLSPQSYRNNFSEPRHNDKLSHLSSRPSQLCHLRLLHPPSHQHFCPRRSKSQVSSVAALVSGLVLVFSTISTYAHKSWGNNEDLGTNQNGTFDSGNSIMQQLTQQTACPACLIEWPEG